MKTLSNAKTRNDLADLIAVKRSTLSYVLYIKGIDNMYTSFEIPKKNGDKRIINKPNDTLIRIQRSLATLLTEMYEGYCTEHEIKTNISHAFQNGKGIITNAQVHKNKRYVYNIDLKSFFESIHFGRIKGFFLKNKIFCTSEEVATVIAQLSTLNGSLPQGAPTSPIISNLICNILDIRILSLAKKFKLDYTRYADDLTFSTNDKHFLINEKLFYHELKKYIESAGFSINENKVRLCFRDSRQEVTGLVVNKKININRSYYKITRAMADSLYRKGKYYLNGEVGSIKQLEGRFAFIDQIDHYNNRCYTERSGKKKNIFNSTMREKEYQKFLFFKLFYVPAKPLILCEGKTDSLYLKAAIKNLVNTDFDISYLKESGQKELKIDFLRRTKRLRYFFNFSIDGADTMKNIYNMYMGEGPFENYYDLFSKLSDNKPAFPIILLYDNELKKDKPLQKFIKYAKLTDENVEKIKRKGWIHLKGNLFLLTIPIDDGIEEAEIESLLSEDVLKTKLGGKVFSPEDNPDYNLYYGKERLSKYVIENYESIDFSKFRPLFERIKAILNAYENEMI